ncbi:MAG: immunoglobulin-like domain-containing protein [Patescibacteria group bacterium UBA2103]
MSADSEKFIPTKEAASLVGRTSDYVGRLAREGKIPASRIGRSWVVSKRALLEYFDVQESVKEIKKEKLSQTRKEEYKEVQRPKANVGKSLTIFVQKLPVENLVSFAVAVLVVFGSFSLVHASGLAKLPKVALDVIHEKVVSLNRGIASATNGPRPTYVGNYVVEKENFEVEGFEMNNIFASALEGFESVGEGFEYQGFSKKNDYVVEGDDGLSLVAVWNNYVALGEGIVETSHVLSQAYVDLVHALGKGTLQNALAARDLSRALHRNTFVAYESGVNTYVSSLQVAPDAYTGAVYAFVDESYKITNAFAKAPLQVGNAILSSSQSIPEGNQKIGSGLRIIMPALGEAIISSHERLVYGFVESSYAVVDAYKDSIMRAGDHVGGAYAFARFDLPPKVGKGLANAFMATTDVVDESVERAGEYLAQAYIVPAVTVTLSGIEGVQHDVEGFSKNLASGTIAKKSLFEDVAESAQANVVDGVQNFFARIFGRGEDPVLLVNPGPAQTNVVIKEDEPAVITPGNVVQNFFATTDVSKSYVDAGITSLHAALSAEIQKLTSLNRNQIIQNIQTTHVLNRIEDLTDTILRTPEIIGGTLDDVDIRGNSNFSGNTVSGNEFIGGTASFGTTTVSEINVTNNITAGGVLSVAGLTSNGVLTGPYFTATSTTATSTFAGSIAVDTDGFVYATSTRNVGIGVLSPSALLSLQNSTSTQPIATFANDSGSELFRFTNTGYLGIGTTSPYEALSVDGNGVFTGTLTAGATTLSGALVGTTAEFTSGTTTNATSTNFFATNGRFTNLIGTNATITAATTTNFYASIFDAATAALTNLVATNATSTNFAVSSLAQGSVPFIGTGGRLIDDNANFYWDDTNNRLGIGTSSPYAKLSVVGQTVSEYFTATSTSLVSTFPLASFTSATSTQLAVNSLTSGRLPYVTTGGRLIDDADLTFDGTTLTGTDLIFTRATTTNATSTNLSVSGTFNAVTGGAQAAGITVNADGYVGINNTSPLSPLDVTVSAAKPAVFRGTTEPRVRFVANGSNVGLLNGYVGDSFRVYSSSGLPLHIGANESTQLRFTTTEINVSDDLIPTANATYDLGSPSFYWDDAYLDSLTVNNLSAASTSIAGTNNASFSINSDNATSDGEDASLVFYRGVVVPNAVITWDASEDHFDFNQNIFIQNDNGGIATSTLAIRAASGQTGNLFTVQDVNGLELANFGVNGYLGLGSSSPSVRLTVGTGTPSSIASGNYYNSAYVSGDLEVDGTIYGTVSGAVTPAGFTEGSVVFAGSGGTLTQDNSNFYWDDSNNRLGIGTSSPRRALHIAENNPSFLLEDVSGASAGQKVLRFNYTGGTVDSESNFAVQSATDIGGFSENLFQIFRNGQVSINGDATPEFTLEVSGNEGSAGYFGLSSNTSSAGNIFIVDGSGNVGIGTTTPGARLHSLSTGTQLRLGYDFDTYADFQVGSGGVTTFSGAGLELDNTAGNRIKLSQDGASGWSNELALTDGSQEWWIRTIAGRFSVRDQTGGSNGVFDIEAGAPAESQSIQSDGDVIFGVGNVGIGTTSPYAKLSVVGQAVAEYFTATSTSLVSTFPQASFTSATSTNFYTSTFGINSEYISDLTGNGLSISGGQLNVATSSLSATSGFFLQNGNSFGETAVLGTNDSNSLAFETGGSTRVTIDTSGNVGIGDTSPDAQLDIVDTSTTGAGLIVQKDLAASRYTTNVESQFSIRGNTDDTERLLIGYATDENYGYIEAVDFGSTFNRDLVLNSQGGNVGIGTTTPNVPLEVLRSGAAGYTWTPNARTAALFQNSSASGSAIGIIGKSTGSSFIWFGDEASETIGQIGFNHTSNTFSIETAGGAGDLFINSSGNVGIGTTTINASLTASVASTGDVLSLVRNDNGNRWALDLGGNNLNFKFNGGNDIVTINNGAPAASLYVGTTGVGIGTTSPLSKLHVAGQVTIDGTNYSRVEYARNGTDVWTAGLHESDDFEFFRTSGSGNIILRAGNLSVGTTSPAGKLHVEGSGTQNVLVKGIGSSDQTIQFGRSDLATNWVVGRDNTSSRFGIEYFSEVGASQLTDNSVFTILQGGNVGIGTTTPAHLLDVDGDFRVGEAGSSDAFFVDATNAYIGVGTTAPTSNLHVAGTGNTFLTVEAVNGNAVQWILKTDSGNRRFVATDNSNVQQSQIHFAGQREIDFIGDSVNDPLGTFEGGKFAVGKTSTPNFGLEIATSTTNGWFGITDSTAGDIFIVDGSGNVGIGTTTPVAKLTVLDTSAGAETFALFGQNSSGSAGTGTGIRLAPSAFSSGATVRAFDIVAVNDGANTIDLDFRGSSGGSPASRVRITGAGNVGIGTTTPDANLSIVSSSGNDAIVKIEGIHNAVPAIKITDVSDSSGGIAQVILTGRRLDANVSGSFAGNFAVGKHYSGGAVTSGQRLGRFLFGGNHTDGTIDNLLYSAGITAVAEGTFTNATTMPTGLAFYTGSAGVAPGTPNVEPGTERLRIDNSGNVGIGTQAPGRKFEVVDATQPAINEVGSFGVGASATEQVRIGYDTAGSDYGWIQSAVFGTSATSLSLNPRGGNVGIGTTTPSTKLVIAGANYNGEPTHKAKVLIQNDNASQTLNNTGGIEFRLSGFGSGYGWRIGGWDLAASGGGAPYVWEFRGNSATWSEQMRLTADGKLGIGTTSPTEKLEVYGGKISVDSGGATDTEYLEFSSSGTTIGGIGRDTNDLVLSSPFGIRLTEGSTDVLTVAGENVIIGGSSFAGQRVQITADAAVPLALNRTTDDGVLVDFYQATTAEGSISVSGNTVSYNAFTGSHYATTNENIQKGRLVTFTGNNARLNGNPSSEILYGITESSVENSSKVLGSMLALESPSKVHSNTNPYLVMAVGNGEVWVVDEGENLEPGDYLISSDTLGHAEKDTGAYPISHIVARVAEPVDWSTISATVDGKKHALVSVTFEQFDKPNGISVDALGNVGIGTSAPEYKLHVLGDAAATSFVNISTREQKKGIAYLDEARKEDILEKLKEVQIAEYRYNYEDDNNPLRLGLIAEEAPTEVLSVSGKGVDIYKLATFTLASVQELATRVESLEERVAALEAQGVMSGSGGVFSTSTLQSALSELGVLIERGFAQFDKLAFRQLIAQKDNDGQGAAGTGTVRLGDKLVLVENKQIKASSKVFVTFTSPVVGSWFITDKANGSFRVTLDQVQTSDVTFDYFIVQTEREAVPTSDTGVVDTEAPIIEIIGANPYYIITGNTFTDPGVNITDNVDQNLEHELFVDGYPAAERPLDTSVAGEHVLTYKVLDTAGNLTTATRAVVVGSGAGLGSTDTGTTTPATTGDTGTSTPPVVEEEGVVVEEEAEEVPVDEVAPVITLTGKAALKVAVGDTFVDAGATATDDVDGDLTAGIVVSGSVDTATAGLYTLTYTVADAAGNESSVSRIVTVEAPVEEEEEEVTEEVVE